MELVTNKLKVVHYAQVPCEPFEVEVKDEREAFLISNILADQHLFLLKENIIPDYSNIIIVLMFEDGDWVDYFNENEGMEFDEFTETYFCDEVN